jgi:gliding motility-associated-like protein
LHPQISMTQIQYYHGWELVKFAFTAIDNYEFFTFGLFGDDAGVDIESFEGPGRTIAYYFVDDFSIRDLTSELDDNVSNSRGDMSNLFNLERSTFVPTAFTPNNDGLNDVFAPSLQANRGALMRVFDRSGAMVWESDDEIPNWEGYTLAGGVAKLGVYVWTLSIVTEDGSVEELSGSVTLLQ